MIRYSHQMLEHVAQHYPRIHSSLIAIMFPVIAMWAMHRSYIITWTMALTGYLAGFNTNTPLSHAPSGIISVSASWAVFRAVYKVKVVNTPAPNTVLAFLTSIYLYARMVYYIAKLLTPLGAFICIPTFYLLFFNTGLI